MGSSREVQIHDMHISLFSGDHFVSSLILLSPPINAFPTNKFGSLLNLLLGLAIIGWLVDRKYKRRGGVQPMPKHWMFLKIAISLSVGLTIILGVKGSSVETIAAFGASSIVVVFALWELGRWIIRRHNPAQLRNMD